MIVAEEAQGSMIGGFGVGGFGGFGWHGILSGS